MSLSTSSTPPFRPLDARSRSEREESPSSYTPVADAPWTRLSNLRRSSSALSLGSSLSGTSDASSDQLSDSSLTFHSRQSGWSLPSYDVPAHQLILKELDLTGGVTKLDAYPFENGHVADIYRGILKISNLPVAVKIFRRMHAESETLEKTSRALYEEARIWRRLKHPNILSLLGIALDLGLSPALISPLCTEPIMKYVQHSSKDPKERLQMVIGVATGLSYLHSEGVVHGNLCTKKVLVCNGGIPVICGYGMSKISGEPAHTTSLLLSPIRFTSPECFSEAGMPSVQMAPRDVYSFSMVALEILSGLEPFHYISAEHAVLMHILRGERPIKTHLDPEIVTNRMWQLLNCLWDQDPLLRPKMSDAITTLVQIRDNPDDDDVETSQLEPAAPLNDKDERTSSGEETAFEDTFVPDIQGRDLTGRVTQDDQYPFAGGGFSNIYRGKLTRTDGRKIRVAIKMIRTSDDGSGQLEVILRRLKREVDIWSRLKHKNVLPFIGTCNDIGTSTTPRPVLISPFYKFGHLGTYLKKHPTTNRQDLVTGVASGLQYLHAHDIIHGDLKVQNVLVDKHRTPRICDPKREDYDEFQVPEGTWAVLNQCWSFDPQLRPTIAEVLRALSADTQAVELPNEEGEELVTMGEEDGHCSSEGDGSSDGGGSINPKAAQLTHFNPFLRSHIPDDLLDRHPYLDSPPMSKRRRRRSPEDSSGAQSVMTDNEDPEVVGPRKKKRARTLTTPHQSAALHALLAQSRFPTTAMREEVGRSIGLSARKVQIWFQNQRQKARRPDRRSHDSSQPEPPQDGTFPNASSIDGDPEGPFSFGYAGKLLGSK